MREILIEAILSFTFILIIATGFFILSKKIPRLPFPLLMFFTGLFISQLNLGLLDEIKLSPESVLFIYLPLLLFESAYRFDFREFKRIIAPGFVLATLGLVIAAFSIAIPLSLIFQINFLESLLFGIIISSTDPIAVLSIFKSFGIPKKLMLLVDGESFLNDATSVIGYRIVLSFIGIGVMSSEGVFAGSLALNIINQVALFIYLIFGGVLCGAIFGWLFSEIISLIKNIAKIEITLTLILSPIVFLLADEIFKVSGIIAVLVCGLIIGNYGRSKVSPSTKAHLHETWDLIGFITTSIVFLLIGYEINLSIILNNYQLTIFTIVCLIFSRAISVYFASSIFNLFSNVENKIPVKWMHILNFGGLRGVLPLIIVFSLDPEFVKSKEIFIQLSLAIILFTLTFNTIILPAVIRALKIDKPNFIEQIEQNVADLIFLLKMKQQLSQIKKTEELNKYTSSKHSDQINRKISDYKDYFLSNVKNKKFTLSLDKVLRKYFLQVEKSVYNSLYKKGVIDVFLYDKLGSSLNTQIDNLEKNQAQFSPKRIGIETKIKKLSKLNYSFISLTKKLASNDEHGFVGEVYLYYKARVLGDEQVLIELNLLQEIINIDLVKTLEDEVLKNI